MNNDELNDDAAFDAFLSGEGELARALQAMPQASPTAELDAAILGRIRTSMAQQSTIAANDPGEPSGMPMLAPGLGMRWRLPAGLAATVLVGLIATQAYQESDERLRMNMPIEEHAALTPAPQMAPPPVADAAADKAEVQGPVVLREAPAAPPQRVQQAPVIVAMPAQAKPVLEAPVLASAPAPAPTPTPAPAVAAPEQAPTGAANATADKPAARSDSIERAFATRAMTKSAPAPRPAPIPLKAMAAPADYLSRLESGVEARAPVTVINQEPASRVEVTGSRIQHEGPLKAAAAWVGQVEALLREGKQDEAKREWVRFRQQYPQYQAPTALDAQMKALLK